MILSEIRNFVYKSCGYISKPGYAYAGLGFLLIISGIICISVCIYGEQLAQDYRGSRLQIISVGYSQFVQQDNKNNKVKAGDIVRVKLNDGNVYVGELVERSREKIVIKIVGIDTEFATEKVLDITVEKNFEDYYKELKELINPQSYTERYRLCQWIHSRGHLVLAEQELEELVADNPKLEEAQVLLTQVRAELNLDSNDTGIHGTDISSTNNWDKNQAGGNQQYRYLNKDEINLLKIYEVDLKDPPNILIARDVITNLIKEYSSNSLIPDTEHDIRLFYRKKPVEILDIIFQLKAKPYYSQVRVLGEPKAFNRFRHDIHRKWLINSCASTECHGGRDAARLFLHNRSVNNDSVVYTNFLIIDRSTTEQGLPLINYDKPEDSPLFQMGMPTNKARVAHPMVPGWKPVFENMMDPLFTNSVEWVKLMYHPHSTYDLVIFSPPGSLPETTPDAPADADSDKEKNTDSDSKHDNNDDANTDDDKKSDR